MTVNPQNVLEQAKRYAAGVFDAVGEWTDCACLSYASNGTMIWHLDAPDKLISRTVSDFHTAEALAARFFSPTPPAHGVTCSTPHPSKSADYGHTSATASWPSNRLLSGRQE